MRHTIAPSIAWALAGCVSAVGAVAKPTALELQLLGAYEELDEALALEASSRGSGPVAAGAFEHLEAEAVRARSIQRFNEDDLSALKDAGCVAEGPTARIASLTCALLSSDPAAGRRLARVVEEENRSRSAIVRWAAHGLARRAGRPSPAATDIEEIERAYRRLLFDTAKPDHLFADGRGGTRKRAELGAFAP
jgi:hypothetical protein